MRGKTERTSLLSHIGRWVAEMVLVFVGVYAAFWLNNYEQRQLEAKRHDQILASLEQRLREEIESGKDAILKEDKAAANFQRALDAGEMPPLQPFVFTTDYNPADIATLLQSGGIELLDPKTLAALRELESVIRWGLSRLQRYQKLSDELIVPNLAHGTSFFYDPATKQLREPFQLYPEALHATADFAHELERTQTVLLQQIQSERRRH